MFTDRKDAAMQLAVALEKYRGAHVLVLGIPRGGAETAYYVALHLDAEFSLLVSRKLGHPTNPEYAIGAIAEDGSIYLNPKAQATVSVDTVNELILAQENEIERRIGILRHGKPLPPIKGRTVIIVDDGIATGATIFAAIEMCRDKQAGKIVVAAPVSAGDTQQRLARVADEVIVLEKPGYYHAVSQAYRKFNQLSDEDALFFMDQWEYAKTTKAS